MMKISKTNKRVIADYSLLLLTIGVSGIPNFSNTILFIPLFLILISFFLLRKRKFDSKFLWLIQFLLFITVVQTFVFNFFSLPTIIGVFLRVIIAYLLVKILKDKFIPYFINTFYAIAVVSLAIYLPTLLFPALGDILLNSLSPLFQVINFSGLERQTILIYNLQHLERFRNSGPFWEPGAFSGYLILAYIFNEFLQGSEQRKKRIIFLVTIITTLSTTAYLALFTFLFFIYYKKIKNVFVRLIIVSSILMSGYYAFISFDFLGAKIESQVERARGVDPYLEDTNTQRFLNILRDIEDFKGHELVGRGSNPLTRYSYDPENQIRTVGLTDILVRMGIPFFLLMMFMLYRSLCSFIKFYGYDERIYCIGSFLTIAVTLMSEVYFNYPLYWTLLFLSFIYKIPKKRGKKLRIK